jgi:hypothetical protein
MAKIESCTATEVTESAQNYVDRYLSGKAACDAMTVTEWLQSTKQPAAEVFDIIEQADVSQDCPLPSQVVKAIEAYYNKLYTAANATVKFTRRNIQDVCGKTIVNVLQSELDPSQLVFIGEGGEVLFSAASGRLFDKDGFHFSIRDLPSYPD